MTPPGLLCGLNGQGQAGQQLRSPEVLTPTPCCDILPLRAVGAAVPVISVLQQCHRKACLVPRATDPLEERRACPLLTPQGSSDRAPASSLGLGTALHPSQPSPWAGWHYPLARDGPSMEHPSQPDRTPDPQGGGGPCPAASLPQKATLCRFPAGRGGLGLAQRQLCVVCQGVPRSAAWLPSPAKELSPGPALFPAPFVQP